MGFLGIILLSISLSMDALGIGISYSIRKIKIPFLAKIIVSVISVIFTAAAIFLGSMILLVVDPTVAKFIGCVMLILLGAFTIYQGFKNDDNKKKNPKVKRVWHFAINFLGLTVKIIKKPIDFDFDKSKHIDLIEAIYLGVALSIDSIAAGTSLAVSGLNSLFIPISVGISQFVFLSLGNIIGKKISSIKFIDPRIFVFISGAILIVLSIVRLF
ncbi:MAG: putative sporulation protein YtaF [Eubacteriales bacterium SKADARSKE-1]|nr:putative sporulation protein YtaF [Eubacteriales bacterium SKADARSKE-1]